MAGQALAFAKIGLDARTVLVNGAIGVVTTHKGELYAVSGVTIRGGRIVEIDMLADPERLRRLDLAMLDG